MPPSVYHLEVRFSGRVQGVGFRARVMELARGFEVTGRVQNLDDGRVHLFAEGREQEVTELLDSVETAMAAYIRSVETTPGSGPRRHSDFIIGD
jgi:acylphosphatase